MTPSEIAALAACFSCIANQQAALLFLLARVADVTIEEIIAGSACFQCIPNVSAAQLFLLNAIVTNGSTGGGGGGTGSVLCGPADPVAAPTGTCALYYNTTSSALFEWDGAAWIFKV